MTDTDTSKKSTENSDASSPATDQEGFLLDTADWSREVAQTIAEQDGVKLTDDHWVVINYVRQFYQEFNTSPAIRPLIKYLKLNWDPEKANSIYLQQLFPAGAAKQSSKISGLPKPTRCI